MCLFHYKNCQVLIQFIITAPFMVQIIFHTSRHLCLIKDLTIAQVLSLAVALCVVILFLFMSSWEGVHDDTTIQRTAVRETIAQHI